MAKIGQILSLEGFSISFAQKQNLIKSTCGSNQRQHFQLEMVLFGNKISNKIENES